MCLYIHSLSALGATLFVHVQKFIGIHRGQILNFQTTFDRACNEIRMEIQTANFFGSHRDFKYKMYVTGMKISKISNDVNCAIISGIGLLLLTGLPSCNDVNCAIISGIGLLLLTGLPSWNKVITYLLKYFFNTLSKFPLWSLSK